MAMATARALVTDGHENCFGFLMAILLALATISIAVLRYVSFEAIISKFLCI